MPPPPLNKYSTEYFTASCAGACPGGGRTRKPGLCENSYYTCKYPTCRFSSTPSSSALSAGLHRERQPPTTSRLRQKTLADSSKKGLTLHPPWHVSFAERRALTQLHIHPPTKNRFIFICKSRHRFINSCYYYVHPPSKNKKKIHFILIHMYKSELIVLRWSVYRARKYTWWHEYLDIGIPFILK